MSYRNYNTANGHLVDPSGNGDYTTIQAAITAASSGQTIFIRPGTYTENLTLKAGVYLTTFQGECQTDASGVGNVQITGKCTFTGAGTVNISNIQLNTNSDYCLAVTGSSASIVNLTNCYINAANNDAINYTSSSSSSRILLYNCRTITGGSYAIYVATGAGQIDWFYSIMIGSSTVNNNSAGSVTFYFCQIYAVLTTSSTGTVFIRNSYCDTTTINVAILTTAGTATSYVLNSSLRSGTASAISAGSGTTIYIEQISINSSNTNAITGAGTINYSSIVFEGSSSTINTTTPTKLIQAPIYATSLTFDNSNVLANFVESTWTPTINTSNSNMTGISYAFQVGRYQRVGNWATVTCVLGWTNSGAGTGNVQGNLPLTAGNVSSGFFRYFVQTQNITFPNTSNYMDVSVNGNTAVWNLEGIKTATTATTLTTTTFTSAIAIFTINYTLGT